MVPFLGAGRFLPGFLSIFALHLQQLHSAPFTVTAPVPQVVAAVGQAAVLPCRVIPERNAEALEVTWFRERFSPFVHRSKAGRDEPGEQMPQFQGRTELLRAGLRRGHLDLRIADIRLSDEGNYTCLVHADVGYEEAVLELRVAAAGSAPLVLLQGYEAGAVRVTCRGSGWYPRPRLQWTDPQGRPLPPASQRVSRDADGLFEAESSVLLRPAARAPLACSIQDPLRQLEKRAALSVADPFFQNAHPWQIAFSVVTVAVVALSIATIFLYKLKGKQEEKIAAQAAMLKIRDAEIEEQAVELAWRRYAVPMEEVPVTLDPDTAHCDLVLSADRRHVKRGEAPQQLPEHPERFVYWRCALARAGFAAGRCYWEVEVDNGGGWMVGVCREDVRRKGDMEFKPEEGVWAVGKWAGQFQALSSPQRTSLAGMPIPKRIRVALDYAEGRVAFFSVEGGTFRPVFTFAPAAFQGGKVYPWVWLGPGTSLKMCPGPRRTGMGSPDREASWEGDSGEGDCREGDSRDSREGDSREGDSRGDSREGDSREGDSGEGDSREEIPGKEIPGKEIPGKEIP